jgi:hypothetical protein
MFQPEGNEDNCELLTLENYGDQILNYFHFKRIEIDFFSVDLTFSKMKYMSHTVICRFLYFLNVSTYICCAHY